MKTQLLTVALALAATNAYAQDTAHNHASSVTQFGQPVSSGTGAPINYSESQLKTATPPVRDAAARTPAARVAHGAGGLMVETFRETVMGTNIGGSGFITDDIDGDGQTELVMGGGSGFGGNRYWYVLRADNNGFYRMVWSSEQYASTIRHIAYLDFAGAKHIVTSLEDGSVAFVNAATLSEVDAINLPAGAEPNRVARGDADNDGQDEFVVLSDNTIYLYDAADLSYKSQIDGYGGGDFEVGNVDADANIEIIVADGTVLEYQSGTATVQWDYTFTGFGAQVDLGDIDNDGLNEIVGADAWYNVTTFDADINSPKWQEPTSHDVGALRVADITGDGVPEVLYGDGQWGDIHALAGANGAFMWSINNPEHGTTNIAVADTDDDGVLEIIWGAGATSSGPDYLYVHDVDSQAREWQSAHLDGPFVASAVGDADNDGRDELVFASFDSGSGFDGPVVMVYDATTYELEWQSPEDFFNNVWHGANDLIIGDTDGDGLNEVAIAASYLHDGRILVVDVEAQSLRHDFRFDDGTVMTQIAVGDVDNDGMPELVAGAQREHTGAPGVYVYVIDGATGVVEWNSVNLGSYWSKVTSLEVANLDDDAALEIVATNELLYMFDGITHQQWQTPTQGYLSATLIDADSDGKLDVLAGMESGVAEVRSGTDLAYVSELTLGAGPVTALASQNQNDGSGGDALLGFATDGTVGVYGLNSAVELWRSSVLGDGVGQNDHLHFSKLGASSGLVTGSNISLFAFATDLDGDALADNQDNCILLSNPAQRDTDGDGYGNRCDADLNNDGIVNVVDLGLFRQVYFTADADADFDGDGVVNVVDLGIIRQLFFAPPGPSGVAL